MIGQAEYVLGEPLAEDVKIKILVCYYQPWELPTDNLFMPIQAGKAVSGFKLNMQGDDTGDNISSRNATFSEFTAWYWVWKNIRTIYKNIEYIGLSHYRRYFNLEQPHVETPVFYTSKIPVMRDYGDIFINYLNNADIILSKAEYFGCSLKNQYAFSHYKDDYICIKNIIHRMYPEYAESFDTVFEIHGHLSLYCMLVTKYTLLDEYFTWLFRILFEAEKIIDVSKYTSYQKRYLAFISERLLNVYVYHHRLKVAYAPIYFITGDDFMPEHSLLKIKKFIKNFVPYGILQMRERYINYAQKKRVNNDK